MSKLPLFEREVDKIVTDNSKVIAALQSENAKLQQERDVMQTQVAELREKIKRVHTVLNIIRLNGHSDKETQMRRVLKCLYIIAKGE